MYYLEKGFVFVFIPEVYTALPGIEGVKTRIVCLVQKGDDALIYSGHKDKV